MGAKKHDRRKIITSLNNYSKKELANLTTPDFKLRRTFSNEIIYRKTFLGSYLQDSKVLIAKYKIIERPDGKDRNYYVVLDQSQYLKLLDIKFPEWKMTIRTTAGKVSQVTLEPMEDYESCLQEFESKTAAFQS